MSVPVLSQWLAFHASTPMNLDVYRSMFTTPGLCEGLPTKLEAAADKKELWGRLLVDLTESIQETYGHGLLVSLHPDKLFHMLVTRLRGVRYSQQEVQDAVALLTHPAIRAAISQDDGGIALAMNRRVLAQAIRRLADRIETVEAETQE